MKSMRDAVVDQRPWLLLPGRPCGFCGLRTAKMGDLCCFCAEDEESREQYIATMREDEHEAAQG